MPLYTLGKIDLVSSCLPEGKLLRYSIILCEEQITLFKFSVIQCYLNIYYALVSPPL